MLKNGYVEGYIISPDIKIAPTVVNGASSYNPTTLGGLTINIHEPLVSWYKAYRRYHGFAPTVGRPSSSTIYSKRKQAYNSNQGGLIEWQDSSMTVGPATFQFNRTLRVPDDATSYALPPGLGTFPFLKAQEYAATIPDYIEQRGGYIMPLFQREALWISISGVTCAIKISVGGVNAITGYRQDEESPLGVQDYLVGGKQPWLDGIATEPGIIRQFVAMKLGNGYTIEEQLSNNAKGGIQIDVFPSLAGIVTFTRRGEDGVPSESDKVSEGTWYQSWRGNLYGIDVSTTLNS
ncbi:hypothetical protein DL96DRAFT_1687204 [Flagelloscypha sp. PMI_526]|nr:hypothetical protein DL96DRAFT_1687204 [Flagelloscypha sp. PMI_526]